MSPLAEFYPFGNACIQIMIPRIAGLKSENLLQKVRSKRRITIKTAIKAMVTV